MRNPLDPFSKVVDDQSHWDPEWYSWLTDMTTTTTQLETTITSLQASLAAQQAINASQQAAITALQNPPPGVATGLVFIQSQTVASPVATVVFTGINATYDAYQFHLTRMKPSVNGNFIVMQISLNGGSTWKNTSNVWTWVYSYSALGAVNAHNNTAEANSSYFRISGAAMSAWANNSEVTLYPSTSGIGLNMCTWRSVDWYDTSALHAYQVIGSGVEVSDSTACNAVRFLFSSGNIASGRISMYGLRKS